MEQQGISNAFGLRIPEIKEVLNDPTLAGYIEKTLEKVLGHLGISSLESEEIIRQCLENAASYKRVSDYESVTHKILDRAGVTQEIPKKLTGRADQIFQQIKPYLLPGSVLDLGSGDGRVGELCAKNGYKVLLTDVYKNQNIDNTGLEFKLFQQGEPVPVEDDSFDNTLALTVYHHSSDPVNTIRESCRVTKSNGRVLVIESVYGVTGDVLSGEAREKAGNYLSLSEEQQRTANVFFDHFYNRVIHYSDNPGTKVNVPFNFNTPEGWKRIFENEGFGQEEIIHLGTDQLTVPEYHTLHVLRKIKK
ncbi:MAG: class I SAM-dependent methyltransferase [Bacteroidota bacterium]